MKLRDIILDEDIYPRQHMNQATIESYAEALKAGAKFPPIEVQRILEDKRERVVVLDGLHRVEAYKLCDRSEIDIEYWKEESLDKAEHLNDLRFEAIRQNLIHGDRLSQKDKKEMAREIVEGDEERKLSRDFLAEKFGVHRDTITDWIKDIRARQQASKESFICKLSLLGWLQQEIADLMELDRSTIAGIVGEKANTFLSTISDHKAGKSVEEIAEFYELDLSLVYAILLEKKSDLERFGLLEREDLPKLYDVWNFSERDKRFGIEYPGNVPAGIVFNALYYYTKEGDLIVDPMAGGGVVIDCCLVMGRKCKAFDIKSVRKEIQINDITKGYPKGLKKCDLVFLDPPYYKKKDKDYGENSISALNRNEFIKFFGFLAEESMKISKIDSRLVLLMEPYVDYENSQSSLWVYEYILEFLRKGWKVERIFDIPETTQRYQAYDVERAKENKQILTLRRQLVIFRR